MAERLPATVIAVAALLGEINMAQIWTRASGGVDRGNGCAKGSSGSYRGTRCSDHAENPVGLGKSGSGGEGFLGGVRFHLGSRKETTVQLTVGPRLSAGRGAGPIRR